MALDPITVGVVGGLLIVVGLILAFFGGVLVRSLMGIIGAVIGGVLGYLGGQLLNNFVLALVLAAIGAILGALFFSFIVRFGVSLVIGLLAAGATWDLLGGSTDPMSQTSLITILVLIVVTLLSFLLFKRLLGVFTALAGGLLVGNSVNQLAAFFGNLDPLIAGGIGLAIGVIVFIAGAIRQARAG